MELVKIKYIGETTQLEARRSSEGKLLKSETKKHVPPPVKKFKYYDVIEQREKVFEAHPEKIGKDYIYEVPKANAALLVKSPNFELVKAVEPKISSGKK